MTNRILIIDDDAQIREMLSLALEMNGYQVYTASDGQDGIRQMYDNRPDLVITDLNMPGMNGYQFSKTARLMSDVPIIMMSGSEEQLEKMLVIKLLGNEIDDFLTKPIDIKMLLECVAQLMSVMSPDEVHA